MQYFLFNNLPHSGSPAVDIVRKYENGWIFKQHIIAFKYICATNNGKPKFSNSVINSNQE